MWEATLSKLHPIYVLTEAPASSIQIDSLHVPGEQLFPNSTFVLVRPSKMNSYALANATRRLIG